MYFASLLLTSLFPYALLAQDIDPPLPPRPEMVTIAPIAIGTGASLLPVNATFETPAPVYITSGPVNYNYTATFSPQGLFMSNPIKIYNIFVGDTWQQEDFDLIYHFEQNLARSSWYALARKHYYNYLGPNKSSLPMPCDIQWAQKSYHEKDPIALKINYTRQNIFNLINAYINKGLMPSDPDGIYSVFFGPDVSVPLINGSCGAHNSFNRNEANGKFVNIKYMAMINPKPGRGCIRLNNLFSPNGNVGLDAMIRTLGHEIIEVISSPTVGSGWVLHVNNTFAIEPMDMCVSNFSNLKWDGPTKMQPFWSHRVGTKKFLLHDIWVWSRKKCEASYYSTSGWFGMCP